MSKPLTLAHFKNQCASKLNMATIILIIILPFSTIVAGNIPDFDFPNAGDDAKKKCFRDNEVELPKIRKYVPEAGKYILLEKESISLVDAARTGRLAVFRCVHEKGASLNSFDMILMSRTLTGDGKWEAGPEKEGTVWPVEVAIRDNRLDIVEYVLSRVTRIYSTDEQWRREEALDFAYKHKNEQAKTLIRRLIREDLVRYYKGKRFELKFFSDIPMAERNSICHGVKDFDKCINFPGFTFYAIDAQ